MIFFGLAVLFGIVAFVSTKRWLTATIVFFFTWLATYLGMPALKFGFWGLPMLIFFTGLISLIIEAMYADYNDISFSLLIGPIIQIGIGFIALMLMPLFMSAVFWHATALKNVMGEVKESVFTTDISPIDLEQIRIVDQQVAWKLGEKRLGEERALGSQVKLEKLNIQKVNGHLYWVGALNHSGFFKWFANKEGTPGYVMVSATNERDVHLVRELNGKPIRLRYNMGSFFGDNPARYVYTRGFSRVGLTDFTFEIDEEGRPYWVITQYQKKVGYAGNDAVGVAVLDAQTGEIKSYGINDAPAWVDRIQPEDFMMKQLDHWGRWVHGWPNFSNRDKLKPTPGMSLVYGESGNSYWYTGMTSVGADESTVGFMLINTRTKEARLYKQGGATETAAMESAKGQVQEKGYTASFPILYNVGGRPTYFTTLKDKEGLVKLMAFVSVENYQVVGTGETIQSAYLAYSQSMASRGNDMLPDSKVSSQKAQGKILRISRDTQRGNTFYYLIIEGQENKAFVGSVATSIELSLSREGDTVEIGFEEGGNPTVIMTAFDNKSLEFQKTESQIKMEMKGEKARESLREKRSGQNAEAIWERLTPEEKARLVEQNRATR